MKERSVLLLLVTLVSMAAASFNITTVLPESRSDNAETVAPLYGEAFNRAGMISLSNNRSRAGSSSLASALYSEEILELQLFHDLTVEVQKTSVETLENGGIYWKGDLIRGEDGYLVLYYKDDHISGTLYSSDVVYNLNSLDPNTIRVVESDPTRIAPAEKECTHNHEDESEEAVVFPAMAMGMPASKVVIDVLVLYPPSIESQVGGSAAMDAEVNMRVAEINEVFNNSRINTRYNLVHHQSTSAISASAKLQVLSSNSTVRSLRDQYKADVVSFWSGSGGSAGSGYNLDGGGSPDNGYNTSKFSLVQSYYTFVHECGHNMGAKHDRAAYGSKPHKLNLTPYYRYGKSYSNYRSVMSYNNCTGGGSCPRVPYYTNPDITVKGAPFGVRGESQSYDVNGPADNSRRLNGTVSIVAAWRRGTVVSTYELVVHSGYGDGNYSQGGTVEIVAKAASQGKVFDHWEGDTQYLANASSATTTVTMPAKNITVTAVYSDIVANKYQLTVHSGSGDGEYEEGSIVSISATSAATGKVFDRWEGDTQYLASTSSATTTVTIPAKSITITAKYRDVAAVTYLLTVNNGTGSGEYEEGTEVPITASTAPEGKVFDAWTGDIDYLANVSDETTTVTTPASAITVTATYKVVVALDTSNLSVNLITFAGWEAVADTYGSEGTVDSSNIANAQIGASLIVVDDNTAAEEYSWCKMSSYLDSLLTDVTVIAVTYRSDKEFKLVLEQKNVSDAGTAYYHKVPASSVDTTVYLAIADFVQPQWEGSLVAPLELNKVKAVSFEALTKSATTALSVSNMRFTNYPYETNPVGIASETTNTLRPIGLQNMSNSKLSLNIARAGMYSVSVVSLSGRLLMDQQRQLTAGVNSVPLAAIRSGVYIVRISGEGVQEQFKAVMQ